MKRCFRRRGDETVFVIIQYTSISFIPHVHIRERVVACTTLTKSPAITALVAEKIEFAVVDVVAVIRVVVDFVFAILVFVDFVFAILVVVEFVFAILDFVNGVSAIFAYVVFAFITASKAFHAVIFNAFACMAT
jgi:hypothetical protein